ncbi:MAG: HAD-IIB family hydrolase [Chitinophagaceae bacterium]|nr:HAD-IIB family hydrolase [Chitinophagaceae bacterium]
MDFKEKQFIIFDLDGTLTASKSPLESETADLLSTLLKIKKVAVISGCNYNQFQKQFLKYLPSDANLNNLYILPVSGAELYTYNNDWTQKYSNNLSLDDKKKILFALDEATKDAGYETPKTDFGLIIEDRNSQITFSGLGQNAPIEMKKSWDPTLEKRKNIVEKLNTKLPDFNIQIGGTTSIDITKKGIDKSYGIKMLIEITKISKEKMLFVGDALFEGGNDLSIKNTKIDCIQVNNLNDTREVISRLL